MILGEELDDTLRLSAYITSLEDIFYNVLIIQAFGLLSLFIKEKCYISETLVAASVGIIFGKRGLNRIYLEGSAQATGACSSFREWL